MATTTDRTALVIGGGVAGPVAAMALQRVGLDATVYEAYEHPTADVGSYLGVATNGIDALQAIDAHQPVLAAGFPTAVNVLVSATGRRLGTVSNGGRLADGTVAHTLKRATLARVLREEAEHRGIRIGHGKRLVTADHTTGGTVVAQFDDGTTARGDVLIGADGVHSITRRAIDPDAPTGRYIGLTNFGGYTEGVSVITEPGEWHMIFGKRAFFGYVVDPSGGIAWFANVPRPPISAAERAATTTQQWTDQLVDLFADDHGPAFEIIASGRLEFAADNTHDLPSVPTWHNDSMVIIGDAAHAPSPTSGQGASMAIEDAVVLAKCLRDISDTPTALATYERLRRDRVERIVAQGARTGRNKTSGPVGRALADVLLPVVFKLFVTEKKLAWMYNHHINWDAPHDTPSLSGRR
jgi:2-polyprenyl-6-methoxyphenol hydroxylase-like FAD-dependent oxidoreductase